MSPKNRIYTLIPEKSFAAFCRSETLDEVLSALITDEDEAADVVEEGTKVPHDAKDFVAIGSKAADAMLQTIATWLRRQDSTIKAQNQMFAWDPKVCLWTCARTVRIVGRELDGIFYRSPCETSSNSTPIRATQNEGCWALRCQWRAPGTGC